MVCRSQAQHGEATLADALAKGSKTGAELAALRTENQQLMQVGALTSHLLNTTSSAKAGVS